MRLGPIAVVCGGAATGKSTLAAALGARSGARVLSSDVVRKELVGIPPTTRAPQSAYSAELNRQTYLELGRRAAAEEPVVVDATFRYAADRQAFAAAAGAAAEGVIWIECRAPVAVIARRAAGRSSQPDRVSDADAAIATRQLTEWEPLTEIAATRRVAVATDRSHEASILAARDALDDRLAAS